MERITFDFATRDDCLDKMVPSDLRVLVTQRDSAATLALTAICVRRRC